MAQLRVAPGLPDACWPPAPLGNMFNRLIDCPGQPGDTTQMALTCKAMQLSVRLPQPLACNKQPRSNPVCRLGDSCTTECVSQVKALVALPRRQQDRLANAFGSHTGGTTCC